MNCEQANEMDLVNYLTQLGHVPKKIRGKNHWYLSPLRKESTASFKVNQKLNAWYDHGIGEGGSLVDFGIKYFGCTVPDFLEKLDLSDFSVPKHLNTIDDHHTETESKLQIESVKPLVSRNLIQYLERRGIDIRVAKKYCNEVAYSFGDKSYVAIGFKNDQGGYEIRDPFYKYSSSPKAVSTFINNSKEIAVFEGFMDCLSYLSLQKINQINTDFLVLNGAGLFEKSRAFLETYERISLFLDRDATGQKLTEQALKSYDKYEDKSGLYEPYKDLNEWLMLTKASKNKKSKLSL
ncbi:DNA primase [Pedobacter psychrophilus]|uniref:DNA primase n=1 Tax=Pedobacter psychrophilus TaxID=1826909 RepID=A0A179DMN4_9SPHI|nr:toprim domain-containing protein [Pedobacter psychrophilus]OAQ41980.1 DNA primase [Pedobacter psychrophilus]